MVSRAGENPAILMSPEEEDEVMTEREERSLRREDRRLIRVSVTSDELVRSSGSDVLVRSDAHSEVGLPVGDDQ